jgi:hypothetical protein
MNIDKKMLTAAERKRDLCHRFLSIARNSDGADPQEEDDGDSVMTADSFERFPIISDDENPR